MVRRRGILGGIALVGAGVAIYVIVSRGARGREELAGKASRVVPDHAQDLTRPPGDSIETKVGVDASKADTVSMNRLGWTLRGRLLRYPDAEAVEPTQPVAGALLRLSLDKDAEESKPDFAPREVRSGLEWEVPDRGGARQGVVPPRSGRGGLRFTVAGLRAPGARGSRGEGDPRHRPRGAGEPRRPREGAEEPGSRNRDCERDLDVRDGEKSSRTAGGALQGH